MNAPDMSEQRLVFQDENVLIFWDGIVTLRMTYGPVEVCSATVNPPPRTVRRATAAAREYHRQVAPVLATLRESIAAALAAQGVAP